MASVWEPGQGAYLTAEVQVSLHLHTVGGVGPGEGASDGVDDGVLDDEIDGGAVGSAVGAEEFVGSDALFLISRAPAGPKRASAKASSSSARLEPINRAAPTIAAIAAAARKPIL